MAGDTAALDQATDRVKEMRKGGTSIAKIAAEIGVSPIAIRTIVNLGAQKTRGKNKRRILAWIANTGGAGVPSAQPAATGGRRGRPGRRPGLAAAAAAARATLQPSAKPTSNTTTLEIDGRTVRLEAGHHYVLHNGQLLHRV